MTSGTGSAQPRWYAQPGFASEFCEADVAEAYSFRYPYPDATFDLLRGLIDDPGSAAVLDLGCGQGEIARLLAPSVARVDAIDMSAEMIGRGRRLPGGTSPRLRWIVDTVEAAPLEPPYALVTAGISIHWLSWPILFGRLAGAMTADGLLAIADRRRADHPWSSELKELIRRYRVHQQLGAHDFGATVRDVADHLAADGFFQRLGNASTAPVPYRQSVDHYCEALHSRNGLGRAAMGLEAAARFDLAAKELVTSHCPDGYVNSSIQATVTWGRPISREAQ